MNNICRGFAVSFLLFGLLSPNVAAKPINDSMGLNKGNRTFEVPANTWVGVPVVNTVGNGTITKIELLVDDQTPAGLVRMAIYDSTPCLLKQDLGYATVTDGWVTISGLNISVTAGYPHILMFDFESTTGVRAVKKSEIGSFSATFPYDTGSLVLLNQSSDAPRGSYPSSIQYVIRATITPD